jgi:hypothetical protein
MLLAATTALVMLTGALLMASAASAANIQTLDAQADGLGNVAMDSSGNVYVAWNHTNGGGAADTPMFCKFALGSTCTSPVTLTLPSGSTSNNETDANFPVLGPGSTVYVVGPRYDTGDTVVWTSTNGGATFDAGIKITNGDEQTGPESVLLDGSNLLIGAVGSGNLAFDATPITAGGAATTFKFSNPASGGVSSSALALAPNGSPVEAYWTLSNPQSLDYYYYNSSGSTAGDLDTPGNWSASQSVGVGQTPSLAGGSGGLYLLSADGSLVSNAADPTAVDVRSYNDTSHTFGAPVPLLANPESGFDEGGGIAETADGKVVAIWPDQDSSGNDVLDSFTSANGAAPFTPEYIATRSGYGGQASVAAIDTSSGGVEGVVAWHDDNGLELANLTPISVVTPQATALTTVQTSGSSTSADLTIPAGTIGETDHATISGTNASSATGTVVYALYSKSSCAASSLVTDSTVSVSGGAAGASAPVTANLTTGTYYWQAFYSGNSANDASASTCGSEVLTVVPAATLGGGGTSTGTTITVTVTCDVVPCTVTITITADPKKKGKSKTITLAKGTFTLHKSGKQNIKLKLSGSGKSDLKKHHGKLKALLSVSVKTSGGLEKYSRTIHITTKKPHHKK